MERLRKLIKEALSTPPKKDTCNCGCHDCDNVGNPGVVINESLGAPVLMTENLRYHVENKLPLTENTFRYGSKSFLDLWAEARYLYVREAIHVNDLDKEILTETNLGEYGIFEGNRVPLDMPMVDEELTESDKKDPPIGKPKRGGSGGKKYYVYVRDPKTKRIKKVSFGDSGGLKAKINNPEARRAFVARHKCGQGEEKTSAKWWSCRLPKFAKSLGINTTFTGFW
jgi:hypothetical protein